MRTDDGHIINECLNGDSASFGLLVDKYKAGIFALAYSRLHNFHDAEDVTQEVFIKAYKSLQTLKRWDSFVVWLRSATINLCNDRLREQLRRRDVPIHEQTPRVIENASLDSYRDEQSSSWRSEALDSLNKALSFLPEQYRQVLTLHYLGGMSGEEISKFLSISHATVRQRLSRAREYLKAEVLAMMGETLEQQRLQATFTFRIVEMVKHIKIHPVSTMKNLPWGLSLATGIIIAVMIFNPALISFNHIGTPIYSPLPVESKVLKVGEIPVDVVKTSNITILSSKMGKGKGGEPENMQNAFFMAPKGEGGIWAMKPDMITKRACLSSSVVNGKIYVIGGTDMSRCLTTMEEYDPMTNKWTIKADMPTGRWGLAASVVNGKIYIIGGAINIPAHDTQTVEEYDPVLDKWAKKANMPTARNCFSASVVNGKIYAIGGYLGDNGNNTSIVEEYDPVADEWTRKTDMPTVRNGHSASVVNGKIYAIGGWCGWSIISTVEEYNPVADKWTKKADMPTARNMLATSVLDGKIYAIGGWSDPGDTANGLSTVEVYDPVIDKWTKGVDMTTGRGMLTASEDNGKLYVIGGFSKFPSTIVPTVEEYTPEGWQAVSPQGKLPKTWGNIKSR